MDLKAAPLQQVGNHYQRADTSKSGKNDKPRVTVCDVDQSQFETGDISQSSKLELTLTSRTTTKKDSANSILAPNMAEETPSCSSAEIIHKESNVRFYSDFTAKNLGISKQHFYEQQIDTALHKNRLNQVTQELTSLTSSEKFDIEKQNTQIKLKYVALLLQIMILEGILNCGDQDKHARHYREINKLFPWTAELEPDSRILALWEITAHQAKLDIKKLPRQERELRQIAIGLSLLQDPKDRIFEEEPRSEATEKINLANKGKKNIFYGLTNLERALIVSNYLYQPDDTASAFSDNDRECIKLFELYRHKLTIILRNGEIHNFEFELILIALARSIIKGFNRYLKALLDARQLYGNDIPKELITEYKKVRTRYLDHLKFFIEHNLPALGDAELLEEAITGILLLSSLLQGNMQKSMFRSLCQHIDQKTKTVEQNNWLDAVYVHYLEISEDADFLNQTTSNVSRYPCIATFSVIIQDLLTPQQVSGRFFSASKSLAQLETVGESQQDLDSMHDLFLQVYQESKTKNNNLGNKNTWIKKVAIYFAIIGEKNKSAEMCKWLELRQDEENLFYAVALASKKDYQASIELLKTIKRTSAKTKSLLGALYEKRADNGSKEAKNQYLSESIQHLKEAQKTLPTVALDLVRVYQKLNIPEESRRWLLTYKKYFLTLSKTNQEQSRLLLDVEQFYIESLNTELSDQPCDATPKTAKKSKKKSQQTKRPNRGTKKPSEQKIKPPLNKEHNIQKALKTSIALEQTLTAKDSTEDPFQDAPHIADELTEAVITEEMKSTLTARLEISNAYINYSATFDELFTLIDQQLLKYKNIVVRSHFIQNKAWLLRDKAFDIVALGRESRLAGLSVNELRTRARKSAIGLLFNHIEKFSAYWCDSLPQGWKNDPEQLINPRLKWLLTKTPLRFKTQFGALFSTLAHLYDDISSSYLSDGMTDRDIQKLYGATPKEFHERAHRFYQFRGMIDPLHKSV